MEDYPSPAEGNGLENRQACKSVRGFESHILLYFRMYFIGSVAQLVEQWIEAPCVGGSIPSRAITCPSYCLGRVAQMVRAHA